MIFTKNPLLFLLSLSITFLSIETRTVKECKDCSCSNVSPQDLLLLNYDTDFSKISKPPEKSIVFRTNHWFLIMQEMIRDAENMQVCFNLYYSYEGSESPLEDAVHMCIKLDREIYDVEGRRIVDSSSIDFEMENGTIFFLFNSNDKDHLFVGCDYCKFSIGETPICTRQ